MQNVNLGKVPKGNLAGLKEFAKFDFLSGFLVFLIALPLSLGIALASGYPAIAGIFTAIVGGVVTTLLSNSELTIKGPAAGLIVIALGCVTDFGFTGGRDLAADLHAYRLALGVGVASGIVQILFGLLKVGVLGELFPLTAVHGMLASIGIIIIAKQFPVLLGVSAKGGPLELLLDIPHHILNMNPEIAVIGVISLAVLFTLPLFKNRLVKKIPAPMVVVLIAIPLGIWLDLADEHTYTLLSHPYKLDSHFLVGVPGNILRAITIPDFSGLADPRAWKWVVMFSLIGSLESLLSAKAIDMIDPWKRKTNLDRDLLAVGVANTISAFVGGLPMISEIVRSRANIDNGARTRFADFYHGLLLLAAVALFPRVIHRIPLAALGAMLVYTGFRLAHPREFVSVFKIGPEQLVIYLGTIVTVLATDLLTGIFVGIGIEFLFHLYNGAPVRAFLRPSVVTEHGREDLVVVVPKEAAVFANWLKIKRRIENEGLKAGRNVVVNMADTKLVDHTVMEKLHELEKDFLANKLMLTIEGLDLHRGLSEHPLAAKKRVNKEKILA